MPGCTAVEPDSVSPTVGSIDSRRKIVKAIDIGSLVMPEKTDKSSSAVSGFLIIAAHKNLNVKKKFWFYVITYCNINSYRCYRDVVAHELF